MVEDQVDRAVKTYLKKAWNAGRVAEAIDSVLGTQCARLINQLISTLHAHRLRAARAGCITMPCAGCIMRNKYCVHGVHV